MQDYSHHYSAKLGKSKLRCPVTKAKRNLLAPSELVTAASQPLVIPEGMTLSMLLDARPPTGEDYKKGWAS
jgi:hypothetical protein